MWIRHNVMIGPVNLLFIGWNYLHKHQTYQAALSFTNNLRKYCEVNFGNEAELPRCSCYDWGREEM